MAISWAHLQTPRFHLEIEDAPSFGSMNEPFTPHMKQFSFDLIYFDSIDSLHRVGVCDILRQGCK